MTDVGSKSNHAGSRIKTNMQGSIVQINGEMYRYTRRMMPASQNSLPLFEGSLRRRRWMKWN